MDYDALDKLVKLRDSGAISDEEFGRLKQNILEDPATRYEYQQDVGPDAGKLARFLNRAESVYLRVLRASTLVIATLFVIFAAWLVVSSLYNLSRDPSAVEEVPAEVSPEEIANIPQNGTQVTSEESKQKIDPTSEARAFYKDFSSKYFAVFREGYEPFRQPSDIKLTLDAFDKAFVHSAARVEGVRDGSLDFERDKADLEKLLPAMQAAANLPQTKDRLSSYKKAKKTRVENKVNKTRDERYCAYYGYYIDECIAWDTRTVSYTDTEVEMQLPKGVVSHTDAFGAYQDNFMRLITSRREKSLQDAEAKRQEIVVANAEGKQGLWVALQVAGAFLMLMFFFLLIAIERHQRRLAARLTPADLVEEVST